MKVSNYECPKFTPCFGAAQSTASDEGCHLPLPSPGLVVDFGKLKDLKQIEMKFGDDT